MPPTTTPADLQQIESLLLDRQNLVSRSLESALTSLPGLSLQGLAGIKDIAASILEEGLNQAKTYQEKVVEVYGDISTQSEQYGKSAAKLSYERTRDLQQDFLQMETGGIKLMDVYRDVEAAADDAASIISNLPGSTAQFTEDLQKQNLSIVQLLKKAAGLSAEQTAAIMKIAKARGEDSKQMLADIGTFSKTLADKFGLDAKNVARSVADITANASMFGKVSVEAATAAAAKFEALGVSVDEVSDSIGQTFGSFSGAADAAAKLSQVFGVNIDSMQMMVDVNSGPEGLVNAVDSLREKLIGAGVDASELSPPLRRLIKEMTGVRDDATIDSLFDPDRIAIETDDILESAKKAAEAQQDPLQAIKTLDKDIGRVYRTAKELQDLTSEQVVRRMGGSATEAAKSFADLNSSLTSTVDSINQLATMQPTFDKSFKGSLKVAEGAARVLTAGTETVNDLTKNTAVQTTGTQISASTVPNYGEMQTPDRGMAFNERARAITGYELPAEAIQKAEVQRSINLTKDVGEAALAEQQQKGAVSQQTSQQISDATAGLTKSFTDWGLDTTAILNAMGISQTTSAPAQPGVSPVPQTAMMSAIQPVGTAAALAPAPASPTPGTAAAPATATATATAPAPAVTATTPVVAPPAIAPTPAGAPAAAPAAPTAPAPAAAPAATTTTTATGPASITGATPTRVGSATATTTSQAPMNLSVNVTLDAGAVAAALAKFTNVAVTT